MRRFPPFWGGRPVDCLAAVLGRLSVWLGRAAYAIQLRGRCWQCGDVSPRGRFCSKHPNRPELQPPPP